ncbi:MAG: MFS transporter [Chloroflexota bacterium]|nr:MFS transporter [Chloroflexota bacterium]
MRSTGLWRHPDFVRLWAAASISTFGSLITRTAVPFTAILVLDANAFDLGLLRVAELLPGFLLGLVAGAWIDRVRRRPVMIGADLLRAVLLLTIPLAAVVNLLGLWQLAIVAALTSVLSILFDVAYQSYLPSLVSRAELVEGNSKLTAANAVAEVAAFSAGGWLVQLITAPFAILVDALTFLVSALFIRRIEAPEPPPPPVAAETKIVTEIGEGLRVIWINPTLRALAGSNAMISAGYGIGGTVFLLYVNQEIGFGAGVLGMVFAVGGVSALAGAGAASRLAHLALGPLMIATLVVWAGGQALVPLATTVSLLSIIFLVLQQVITDSAATVYDINQVSLRQAITPDRLLGRVNATVRVLEVGVTLVATVAAGLLAEIVGLRFMLVVEVVILALAGLWLYVSPVRQLRATPALPDPILEGELGRADFT